MNVEEHWHDCIEFQFILEGKAEQTINAKRYITAEGELALILGGDIHATRCRPGQRTRIMVLKFMPSLFESGGYSFLNKREAVPALSKGQREFLAALFNGIVQEMKEKREGYELMIRVIFSCLWDICRGRKYWSHTGADGVRPVSEMWKVS